MNVLEVEGLTVDYQRRGSSAGSGQATFRAVDSATFVVPRGTTLALVGESGSGKTTVARAVLGLVPLVSGRISIDDTDVSTHPSAQARLARRRVQMVFQQPSGSLDPRMRVSDSVAEPLRHLSTTGGAALRARVEELLEMVGLDPSFGRRYPRQLSGGQRQRVAIARAIAISPSLVICDEPTSSLDVSVQAQVLNLLVRLQEELGLSYLFISHDLTVVRHVADSIAVMKDGRIVEFGHPDQVLGHPAHEYTRELLAAVPSLERATSATSTEPGDGATNGSSETLRGMT